MFDIVSLFVIDAKRTFCKKGEENSGVWCFVNSDAVFENES